AIALGFRVTADAAEINAQIAMAEQIGKEVRTICMRAIPKRGIFESMVNCMHNDGRRDTRLPVGSVNCSFLFTPTTVPAGFDSGKATTEIGTSIKILADKFKYPFYSSTCRYATLKRANNLPPGGIRCSITISPHEPPASRFPPPPPPLPPPVSSRY
ncbi:hypothetical protein PFISCL1PPCAC_21134, partial [Pristionchus fissidentatus]